MLKLFAGLGPLDARTIGRDALLRWVLALPLLIILPMRLVLPAVLARIGAALGADLLPLYTPIASAALLLLTPVLYGMIIGFLLLDQRDDQTLVALQVTPLPAARSPAQPSRTISQPPHAATDTTWQYIPPD